MTNQEALQIAIEAVLALKGRKLDVLTVKRPRDLQAALDLAKVINKLSPIVANTIEYIIAQYLNEEYAWPEGCRWIRQDPDFPDALLSGMPYPQPGLEIKAWFPLATEITARFRASQAFLQEANTKVVFFCWMPEFVIAGEPKIVDVWIGEALDAAQARDVHYHNPPRYVLTEPQDTTMRTRNLQQKNVNAQLFQGTPAELIEAEAFVASWGPDSRSYRVDQEYQALLRNLTGRYPYRTETNFAKMDRIR
jgi:hypothetical protein